MKNKFYLIGFITIVVFLAALSLHRWVSGGDRIRDGVLNEIRNHEVVAGLVGGRVISITESDGASDVELGIGGLRSGRMPISVQGPTGSVGLRVAWAEVEPGKFAVLEIYSAKPFRQDTLVWKAK